MFHFANNIIKLKRVSKTYAFIYDPYKICRLFFVSVDYIGVHTPLVFKCGYDFVSSKLLYNKRKHRINTFIQKQILALFKVKKWEPKSAVLHTYNK